MSCGEKGVACCSLLVRQFGRLFVADAGGGFFVQTLRGNQLGFVGPYLPTVIHCTTKLIPSKSQFWWPKISFSSFRLPLPLFIARKLGH